jgi:hypothetical protein
MNTTQDQHDTPSIERMQEIADAVCEVFNNFGASSDEIISVCVDMFVMAVRHIDSPRDRKQMAKEIGGEVARALAEMVNDTAIQAAESNHVH